MCGRFALTADPRTLKEIFHLREQMEFRPRYNIAPRDRILVVRRASGNEAILMQWQLIPAWAESRQIKYSTFNAVSEMAANKPTFRGACRAGRRCLIPASGFYEWRDEKGGKQPYFFRIRDQEPFAMGGLWERWEGDGEILDSCTILTVPANDAVRPIHAKQRMPFILERKDYEGWLDPERPSAEAMELCRPYPAEKTVVYPVTRQVNRAGIESPSFIEPLITKP